MAVHVGKARCDVQPLGVDLELAAAANVTDRDNTVSRDRYVRDDPWIPGTVKNPSATDDDVVVWGARRGA